jgi:hypothetical protein
LSTITWFAAVIWTVVGFDNAGRSQADGTGAGMPIGVGAEAAVGGAGAGVGAGAGGGPPGFSGAG